MTTVEINPAHLTAFCRRHHIRKLSMFGSRARGEHRPDSDLDLLVEFEPGYVPGFAMVSIEDELASMFGIRVDLRTGAEISPRFRDRVFAEAVEIYGS